MRLGAAEASAATANRRNLAPYVITHRAGEMDARILSIG